MKNAPKPCQPLNGKILKIFAAAGLPKAHEGAKEDPERKLGEMVGESINLLPTQSKTAEDIGYTDLGDLIANIPNYFTRLQEIIESESLHPDKKATSSAAEYQHALFEQRAKKIAHDLEQMTTKTGLGLTYKYLQIIRQLGAHSVDLVNTGAPATKEAYLKSVEKLNQFKHEILPNVIAELESLEESLGLASGTLTEPALKSAEVYYQKLVTFVNKIHAKASIFDIVETHSNRLYGKIGRHLLFGDSKHIDTGEKLEKDEHLTTLMDKRFIEKRHALQAKRFDEAKIRFHETQQSAQSALKFFEKVESLNTYYNNGNFSSVSIEDKQELAHLYKQFQSHMAAINPAFDARIVNLLSLTTEEKEQFSKGKQASASFLQSFWGGLSTGVAYTLITAQHFSAGASNTLTTPENQFSTVLGIKNQLIASMRKKVATERLQIGLIVDTRSQAEESAYARAGEKTTLEVIDVLPKLGTFTFAKKQSAQELYKKSLLMENQVSEISLARTAFSDFIGNLEAIANKNQSLNNLSEEEKERLRFDYKQFQKFIYHLSEKDTSLSNLDAQIVASLTNDEPKLTIEQLLAFKDTLNSGFEKLQTAFEKDRDLYLGQESEARKAPASLVILEPVGGAKNTLFAQVSELKLSTKLDDFLKKSLLPFLKENLSKEVLNALDLDHIKLPYEDTYQDASQVNLYKNLINAFYFLQKGLAEFEQKGDHEYTEDFISRVFFLASTGKSVGSAVYNAFVAIKALKGNSQLAALVEQGLDIVGPIKQLPGVSSFFEGKKEISAPDKEKKHTELIAQSVYKLQLSLLDLVDRTDPQQLPEEYKNLKKLFIDTQFIFLRKAETIFDLKENSLTSKVNEILNRFESDIDKEGAELDLLFGASHPSLETINSLYGKLEKELENIDTKKPLDPEIKAKISDIYKELQPFLREINNPDFDDHFIDKITESSQLHQAVEQLLGTESHFNPPGIIGELQDLFYYEEPDFADASTQEKFKNSYKLLQPYLQELDPDYYSEEFLDSLKGSSDYDAALTKIVRDDGKELISLINEKKRGIFYSHLLSETHELRTFTQDTQSAIAESMVKEKEKMEKDEEQAKKEMQLKRKRADIPEPEKEPSTLKQMVEGLYQVQARINELNSARTIAENANTEELSLFSDENHPGWRDLAVALFKDEDQNNATNAEEVNIFSDENHPGWKAIAGAFEDEQFGLFTAPDHPYAKELAQSFADEAEVSKEIEEIANSFSNVGIKPTQIANVLKSIQKLQAALNNTAVGSHELILASLKELRSEFGTSIIMHADNAEFTLGLKPGALSSQVSKRFDKFYNGLLERIAQASEQKDLLLLIDTTPTEKRIENEKERLAAIKKTSSGEKFVTQIFNSQNPRAQEIKDLYELIEETELRSFISPTEFPTESDRVEFYGQYKELIPHIEREIANVESVVKIHTISDFQAILQKIQFRIVKYGPGLAQQNPQNNEALNHLYSETGKLLKAIRGEKVLDIKHKVALMDLIGEHDKSLSIVFDDGLSKLLNFKITEQHLPQELWSIRRQLENSRGLLIDDRESVFARLTNLLRQHALDKNLFDHQFAKDELLSCYKELIPLLISITGKQNLYYQMQLQILEATGTKEEFKKALVDDLLQYQAPIKDLILARVKTDDFNSKLTETRIRHLEEEQLASEKKQGQDKIEQFKRLKFEQILDVNIRSMLDKPMGPYAHAFFKHIRPAFIKIQEKILKDITVEDNIEDKIAARLTSQFNLLMSRIDENWKSGVSIEPASIAFDTEDELTRLQDACSTFYSANDLYRKIRAIKDDFEKQDPTRKNQLIQSVISEIESLRNEVSQFTQAYKPNDEVKPHGQKVIALKSQLKTYQIITQGPYLEQYNHLQSEKEALTKDIRQKNPIAQQKFDLIEKYERHILEYAKSHDDPEVLAEIKAFHQKLKVFDELMAVYPLNEQLLANLKQNGKQEIPTVYVDSWVYKKLCELRDKIKSDDYYVDAKFKEKFEKDKAAFKQYYSEIQPLLAERDPAFTPTLYDQIYLEIDDVEPLRKALETLAPKLDSQVLGKAKERLQQIELATTFKQLLQNPEMEPEQRKRVVKQFIENEIKTLPSPSFPDRVYEFFKSIFENIQHIFTGKSHTESAEKSLSEFREGFDSIIEPEDLTDESDSKSHRMSDH